MIYEVLGYSRGQMVDRFTFRDRSQAHAQLEKEEGKSQIDLVRLNTVQEDTWELISYTSYKKVDGVWVGTYHSIENNDI